MRRLFPNRDMTAATKGMGRTVQLAALAWRVRPDVGLELLLVTSRTNKRWLLPKGWPIAGKSDLQSALQEAYEEAGIRGKAASKPLGSYGFTKLLRDETALACTMVVYGLGEIEELAEWPEMAERERAWFVQADAIEAVFDPNLGRFLGSLRVRGSKLLCDQAMAA